MVSGKISGIAVTYLRERNQVMRKGSWIILMRL